MKKVKNFNFQSHFQVRAPWAEMAPKPKNSNFFPLTPFHTPQFSCFLSCLMPQFSCFLSCLMPHASCLMPQFSCFLVFLFSCFLCFKLVPLPYSCGRKSVRNQNSAICRSTSPKRLLSNRSFA